MGLTERRKADAGERVLPYSLEAEQGVLGCIMTDPQECLPRALIAFRNAPEPFYDGRHRTLYRTLLDMNAAFLPIDLVTLSDWLKVTGKLEESGGYAYVCSLPDTVPSAANLEYYLEIVREKFLYRQIIATCTQHISQAFDQQVEASSLVQQASSKLLELCGQQLTQDAVPMPQLVADGMEQIERWTHEESSGTGIKTGFPDLDKMTRGMHPGEMIVIAGRPSLGKTSLAMNIVEHAALDQSVPVAVFSLEMSRLSLVIRMLLSRSRVNISSAMDGSLNDSDVNRLVTSAARLQSASIWIDDTGGLNILELRARARRMVQQQGVKLIVIDYLQLLEGCSSRRENSRQQEVTEISRGIKAMSKELNVPVVAICQLNRDVERDKNRRPRLSDLRESGSIEQDADVVGMLYRADRNNPNQPTKADDESEDGANRSDAIPVNLSISKQRNGPTGDVHLVFLRSYTRFETVAKIEPPDSQWTHPHPSPESDQTAMNL